MYGLLFLLLIVGACYGCGNGRCDDYDLSYELYDSADLQPKYLYLNLSSGSDTIRSPPRLIRIGSRDVQTYKNNAKKFNSFMQKNTKKKLSGLNFFDRVIEKIAALAKCVKGVIFNLFSTCGMESLQVLCNCVNLDIYMCSGHKCVTNTAGEAKTQECVIGETYRIVDSNGECSVCRCYDGKKSICTTECKVKKFKVWKKKKDKKQTKYEYEETSEEEPPRRPKNKKWKNYNYCKPCYDDEDEGGDEEKDENVASMEDIQYMDEIMSNIAMSVDT